MYMYIYMYVPSIMRLYFPAGSKEEREKSGKKSKEKKELIRKSPDQLMREKEREKEKEKEREKERERGKEKERRKHSEKDQESDRDSSNSRRKSSSSKKEHSKEKEKGKERSKTSKRPSSPTTRVSKSRRHSSPLSPHAAGISSVKSRLGRRSRSKSPSRSPPARPKFPRMASPTGKGSIRTTKVLPPILSPSEKWSGHSMSKWH